MAKAHRSYRLDEDVLADIAAYADEHGMTQSDALAALVRSRRGVSQEGDTTQEEDAAAPGLMASMRENLADLRKQNDLLAAQLSEKDRQIESLSDIADHAQALQAADKQLAAASEDKKPGRRKLFGRWFSREDKQ